MQNGATRINNAKMKHVLIRSTLAANARHFAFAAREDVVSYKSGIMLSGLPKICKSSSAKRKNYIIIIIIILYYYKLIYCKWKNADAMFPTLSCYQGWFMFELWSSFLTLTDKSEAPVGNARVWPSCSGSCCCVCWYNEMIKSWGMFIMDVSESRGSRRWSGWINNLSKLCCWPRGRHVASLKSGVQSSCLLESEHGSPG